MAKYSTGDAGGGAGGTCELCGNAADDLRTAEVAGATLEVCTECVRHGDATPQSDSGDEGDRSEQDRNRRAAQNAARIDDARKADTSHWEEEGTNYDDDQLPYLVEAYGDRLTEARQDAGLTLEELAEELDEAESDLLAVEQGRATQAGVGGTVIGKLETHLDVELAE